MRSLTVLVLALALVLALTASAEARVTKYTFPDVTLSDGSTTVTGIIYAGVKVTNRSSLTSCDYHSSTGASLGYYADSIAADDPLQFCLAHFAERNM